MSTADAASSGINANGGGAGVSTHTHRPNRRRRRRRRRRPSMAASSETTTDGSFRFSESESDTDQSWNSPVASTAGRSHDKCRSYTDAEGSSVLSQSHRGSCSVSECLSDEEIDLESGELELKVHKQERDCRICHLSLAHSGSAGVGAGSDAGDHEPCGVGIELGCSCKGDLGAAHKQCAETWFKMKGNTICEICGATALNIAGEQVTEANSATAATSASSGPPIALSETRSFWHGRRIMNFLLACMVFAFVISWLFHFNVLP